MHWNGRLGCVQARSRMYRATGPAGLPHRALLSARARAGAAAAAAARPPRATPRTWS